MRCVVFLVVIFGLCALLSPTQKAARYATPAIANPPDTISPGSLDVLYGGSAEWDGSILMTIDTSSGDATPVGQTGLGRIDGLAINSQGEIFGIAYGYLCRLDGQTGWGHPVGRMDHVCFGLAFDFDDVLYTVDGPTRLYTVDTSTGAFTYIGDTGIGFIPGGMAFDPTDGSLYVSHGEMDAIYRVDPQTADAFLIGFTELLNPVPGLACDASGFLYGLSTTQTGSGDPEPGDQSHLILIDKTNGAGTVIGQVKFVTTRSMALAPTVGTGIIIPTVPNGIVLEQNVPNPFNLSTVVRYRLPSPGHVELTIFNTAGQRIRTLVDEYQPGGPNETNVGWDGYDQSGTPAASGVYLYRLALTTNSGTIVQAKKMTLLK